MVARRRRTRCAAAHRRPRLTRAAPGAGWQIFGLAFLFRLQSMAHQRRRPQSLLKVDILNVMGLSMLAGAALAWGREDASRRVLLFGGVAVAVRC